MRQALLIIFLVGVGFAQAQDVTVPLDIYQSWKWERHHTDSGLALHPDLRAYSDWNYHVTYETLKFKTARTKAKPTYVRFYPVVQATGFGASRGGNSLGYETYGGAGFGWKITPELYLGGNAIAGYSKPMAYMSTIIDSLNAITGYGLAYEQGRGTYSFQQSTFKLGWRPSDLFEMSAGRGKHFIGSGYRSMFLSDFAPNYNYLRMDVDVWRLKYTVLYTQMNQPQGHPQNSSPKLNKYSTMHYLDFNITKWWSVGAFEAIVWETKDSSQHRNIDINYLNPIIFMRPVEYSIGSSDNVLLGFSTTFRPARGWTIYGQLLFDEFLLSELRAKAYNRLLKPDTADPEGWWGNKYAYQVGTKYHEPLGFRDVIVLGEFNFVRPFTYGHGNVNQSYTHVNHSLAHPLGANFIEWVAIAMWQPRRWHIGLRHTYSRKGYSNNLGNLGEDPLRSITDINTFSRIHGNFVMQGRRVDVANTRLEVGYDVIPAWQLRVESAIQLRSVRSNDEQQRTAFLTLGMRTALWNDYRDI